MRVKQMSFEQMKFNVIEEMRDYDLIQTDCIEVEIRMEDVEDAEDAAELVKALGEYFEELGEDIDVAQFIIESNSYLS